MKMNRRGAVKSAWCNRERSQFAAPDKYYQRPREGVSGGKLMTMVSVMKKIALFMMVLALAVSLAACQGAVGRAGDDGATGAKGDKGDKGDTGNTGNTGNTGPQGISALNNRVGDIVFITEGGTVADDTVDPPVEAADLIVMADVNAYFVGGVPEGRTFALVGTPTQVLPNTITYKLDDSNLELTITPTWAAPTGTTLDTVVMVSATDTDDQYAEASIRIRSNAPPTRDSAFGAATEFTVGTQDAAYEDTDDDDTNDFFGTDPVRCEVLNECVIDLSEAFEDLNTGDTFSLSLEDIDEDDADKLTAVIDGTNLMITGLKHADDVSLMVTGTDEAGVDASEMIEITVDVDGGPTFGPVSDFSMKLSDATRAVGTAGSGGGTETITVAVTSSDPGIAARTDNETGNAVTITALNEGTATITVTVTEAGDAPVQEIVDEFTVTVTSG